MWLSGKNNEKVELIKKEKIVISSITKVEIISVIGKYARGINGGFQKCNSIVSEDVALCPHNRYIKPRRKWNIRRTKAFLKLVEDIHDGKSDSFCINILPFDESTIIKAQKIILHALENNFGSLDAMIVATAETEKENGNDIIVITSDKALKQCLSKCGIGFWDAFSEHV